MSSSKNKKLITKLFYIYIFGKYVFVGAVLWWVKTERWNMFLDEGDDDNNSSKRDRKSKK